ncbi:MAG: dihydropteroate synthase [Arachidicoccus sp.]|nr:dihydropteroate synthase [Arachidicoccus sp.]
MYTLNCKGTLVVIDKPLVMGIINANNNSFYEGSRNNSIDQTLASARKMLAEGADILDIGGQSTHPESIAISANEEMDRVIPAIEIIVKNFPDAIISIDTYYSKVAKASVKAGAKIVNDISAGNLDIDMISTVASLNVPYIAMHMKGTPQTMKNLAHYEDITREVLDYFIQKIDECNRAGIKDIILDPGFGFAKTIDQNFELMRNLSVFKILEKPLLVGISRKATIYKTLHISAEDALNGTTVLNAFALQNGADIIRVHDVKEARENITLYEILKKNQKNFF